MARPRSFVLWCVGAALVLSACGGGDEPRPRFAAETTPAAGESASPSPSESVVPEDETPEEFIRRWNELDREMQNTGETAAYLAATRGCAPCEDAAALIEEIYADGGSIDFGGSKVTKIEHRNGLAYDVWLSSKPTTYRERAEGPLQKIEGGKNKHQYTLVQGDDGGYFMSFMSLLPG